MTNKEIARVLKETAALIELTGGNTFRARAFASAARTIERLEPSVEEMAADGTLTEVAGIGSGIASQVQEILTSGSFAVRDELLGAIPPGLLDVLKIKGIGAKKVRALWQTLGVQSLDDLEAAAVADRVAPLAGFGARTQESILDGISSLRKYLLRRRYADALALTEDTVRELVRAGTIPSAIVVGEVARMMETVDAIELLAPLPDQGVPDSLTPLPGPASPCSSFGYNGLASSTREGLPLRVYFAPPQEMGRAQVLLTGPAPFVDDLLDQSLVPQKAATEQDAFDLMEIPFIVPELRDLPDVLERASILGDVRLVADSDIRGIIHNHSVYSDGAHTVAQMGDACRALGYSYFGIADHSQSLKIASGMSVEDVRRQYNEVRQLNQGYAEDGGDPFRIFFGVESDILTDGSLDYEDEVLALFDYVVASVHQGFNMSEAVATERLIRAISNPYTTILGHATGRLLLRREGYAIDHLAVLDACAAYGVSVELNANPFRLDIDWRWLEAAAERDVLVSINPDAHAMDQIQLVHWGVCAARKGGLTPDMCLNAFELEDFSAWLKARHPDGGS